MYLIFSFVMAVLCYAIPLPINSLMGPIHNAHTGDCNDSIKPRSSISAPGWCIDCVLVRVREGQVGGSAKCACTDTHTNTISSLIYFRSVLMSSWPRPQLLSAADLATVLMKKQGNSTEVKTHTHTPGAHEALQRSLLLLSLNTHTHTK